MVPADELLGPAISTDGEASLQQLFARCAETPACADAFGDLDARFDALMTELGDAPVTINIAHPRTAEMTEQRVNRDVLAGIIRLSSYQGLTRALVPLMIDRASKGDFTLVGANAALIGEDFGDLLAMGMHNAVVCSEDAPLFSDDADERAARADSYMGNLQFDYLSAVCEIWPQGIVDDDFHEPVSSDVPVLLLSGSIDCSRSNSPLSAPHRRPATGTHRFRSGLHPEPARHICRRSRSGCDRRNLRRTARGRTVFRQPDRADTVGGCHDYR